jgi:hypothetical protein
VARRRSRISADPAQARSVWHAEVELSSWRPVFEIHFRKLVRQADLLMYLTVHQGELPLVNRILREARLG